MIIDQLFEDQTKNKKLNLSLKLDESWLMEDPVYLKFKNVGRYIAERKLTEPEILKIFADAEAGMTDKATGANRTFLGRGKDTAADFAGGVADALKGVWGSIQSSVPVSAVDVAYDKATDALADLAGGQDGRVMQAIKKYRMLAKEYPKTAGLAKAALVAIAGLATGGAGAPAIAAFVYGLDSAVKGEKFSDIALKAGGAAATAWAASKIAGMVGGDQAAANTDQALNLDAEQMARNAADAKAYGIDGADTLDKMNAAIMQTAEPGTIPADYSQIGAGTGVGSGTEYIVKPDDVLSTIAAKNNVSVGELMQANPDITNPDFIKAGQTINIPAETGSSVYQGGVGTNADTMAKIASGEYADSAISQNLARAGQGPELLGGPAAGDVAGATVNAQPTLSFTNGNTGTLSLPDGSQVPVIASPPGAPQPRLPIGSQPVMVNYAGQDVTAYIYNGRAYIKNFSPEQFSNPVQESLFLKSIKMRTLPVDKMIDQKLTTLSWALNESVGKPQGRSMHLTPLGVYTVFENVRRVAEAAVADPEADAISRSRRRSATTVPLAPTPAPAPTAPTGDAAGPGREQLPDLYRPDMADAPTQPADPAKKSWFGRGLDAINRGVGKVGSALSNFGHQFTTNVTKEKLKMNWHQAGKPSDSDQLSAWLVKQGVPIGVVNGVYEKMGLPVSAEAVSSTPEPTTTDPAVTEPQGKQGGAQRQMAFYGTNPATKKPWTYDELLAKSQPAPVAGPEPTEPEATPSTTPGTLPQPTTVGQPSMVTYGKGFEKFMKPKTTTQFPAFGTAGTAPAYKTATTPATKTPTPTIKTPVPATTATLPAGGGAGVKSAVPAANEPMKIGGQTLNPKNPADKKIIDKVQAQTAKVAEALKRPVAEMLSMVETKEDVAKIKQFIDQTFVKYGPVSESAFAVRNRLIEHVTKVGAQRRREFARKS